jgi:hypothetical protein
MFYLPESNCLSSQETEHKRLISSLLYITTFTHHYTTSHAKWIVSSRNWGSIEKHLNVAIQKFQLSLELNKASVATAVTLYICYGLKPLSGLG